MRAMRAPVSGLNPRCAHAIECAARGKHCNHDRYPGFAARPRGPMRIYMATIKGGAVYILNGLCITIIFWGCGIFSAISAT